MCDLVNNGKVITIDIEDIKDKPQHKRIKYLLGSSTSKEIVEKIRSLVGNDGKVMVILDSDHSKQHVINELRIYSKFVTKGSYLIVEDTNINGHPVFSNFGPGPMEAVDEFLKENKDFVVDKTKEKLYLTFNPNGYLKRKFHQKIKTFPL
jgi:cephalosporin hydroxylase